MLPRMRGHNFLSSLHFTAEINIMYYLYMYMYLRDLTNEVMPTELRVSFFSVTKNGMVMRVIDGGNNSVSNIDINSFLCIFFIGS